MSFETVLLKNRKGTQLIQVPDTLKINDDKVYLKKVGNKLTVIPYHRPWEAMFESAAQFSDDFLDERDQPHTQHRDLFE
jgi:antitoxin VapB